MVHGKDISICPFFFLSGGCAGAGPVSFSGMTRQGFINTCPDAKTISRRAQRGMHAGGCRPLPGITGYTSAIRGIFENGGKMHDST